MESLDAGGGDHQKISEITNAMIWAGLEIWFDRDREHDDSAEIVRDIFAAMRYCALEKPNESVVPVFRLRESPFRSPIGAPADPMRK